MGGASRASKSIGFGKTHANSREEDALSVGKRLGGSGLVTVTNDSNGRPLSLEDLERIRMEIEAFDDIGSRR